ncbi:Sialate O-acetylesterase [Liparis tanakae]|uniref:Sialate O-acetylesterase n=1 Tax=Liparis tanakae TaxID=230148 RepID=A0A4Z2IAL9_9TELE|nr:Sialate O-acetylesterase [Liparis tanakae]
MSSLIHKGELRFASYYGDHMVLQKSPERAVLWGRGPEGAEGAATEEAEEAPESRGIWRVALDPVEAGGPYNVTAAAPSCAATLTDVLFGDIWLCGGQSNMWLQMSKIFNASKELNRSRKYPHVRIFMAALNLSETERTDLIQVEIPWSVPPANVAQFSAVCWLFGRYLYRTLQYPIGLVESCWGGTPVEVWSSSRALQRCGLDGTNNSKDHQSFPYTYCKDCSLDSTGPKENSVLWNAMIHPLLNMTVKGAIWYQETSMDSKTSTLSTYQRGSKNEAFPNIRWHQTADNGFVPNSRMRKTFMAVALDLPDARSPFGTIHPRDKQDVARRLTLGARAVAYNEKHVSFEGPFPKKLSVSAPMSVNITYDQKVSVTPSKSIFEIFCSGVQTPYGTEPRWVEAPIMHWGPATVQLSTSSCPLPHAVAAVRYAWRDWPCNFKACAIYSANRVLPAPPFDLPLSSRRKPGT